MPKITTANISNGTVIKLNNTLYSIVEFLHVKPGKGGAFVRTKLKDIISQKVHEKVFRAGEQLESIRVERHSYQFLYQDGDTYYFMNADTFQQIEIAKEKILRPQFLFEGDMLSVIIDTEQDEILYAEPLEHIHVIVSQVEPGLKGDRVQGGNKPALLSTGVTIQVPLFINKGNKIKINTKTGKYIERA